MTTRRKFIGAAAMAACGFAGRNAIGAESQKDAFIWAALLEAQGSVPKISNR